MAVARILANFYKEGSGPLRCAHSPCRQKAEDVPDPVLVSRDGKTAVFCSHRCFLAACELLADQVRGSREVKRRGDLLTKMGYGPEEKGS